MWRYTSSSASKWLVSGTFPKQALISGRCSAKIKNGPDEGPVTIGSTRSAFQLFRESFYADILRLIAELRPPPDPSPA